MTDFATTFAPLAAPAVFASDAPVLDIGGGALSIGGSDVLAIGGGATIAQAAFSANIFDWAVADGDLADDGGLYTAVAISLFTDRLANPDDPLPASGGDRRGWWGDAYLPDLANGQADNIGSRLWLLARAVQIPQTAQQAQAYCREALQWLVDDGVAALVAVPLPTFPQPGMMAIAVTIVQQAAAGPVNHRFDAQWNMTAGLVAGIVYGYG